MSKVPIILAAINARYIHTAFGLRWLMANLGPLQGHAVIREYWNRQEAGEIVGSLLADDPQLVGFAVYIWNVTLVTEVVRGIKSRRPGVIVVLGGPEASHEYEGTELFDSADYLVRGEGEVAFARLAQSLLRGERPAGKVIEAAVPDLDALELPYDLYTGEDIAHRVIYVETSRGCPFRCEFCLSSLEPRVREFDLEPVFDALERLIARGARWFKFVDRTFNLRDERIEAVLDFFRERWREDMQIHLEIVPDRLSGHALSLMAEFPARGLHLEVGIQTFNKQAQEAISRRQDMARTEQVLRFLREQTGAVLHADLIAGLPGESLDSFAAGFDRLVALKPHEIQVGILKRLKGAPIARHAESGNVVFANEPPYEVQETRWIDRDQLTRIKRFARYFDLYHNRGNFARSTELLWRCAESPFHSFMELSDALWASKGQTHRIPLAGLAEELGRFLIAAGYELPETVIAAVEADFHGVPGRKERLDFGRLR